MNEPSALTIPARFREPQFRAAVIEEVPIDTREIVMRAVPYDVEVDLGDGLWERFLPGAFRRAVKDPGRVKLWAGHGGPIVGHAAEVEDAKDGLWLRMKVSAIGAGDDLLTLARDTVLDEASIEFVPIRDAMKVERRADGLHVSHGRAQLRGVALVPHGAYGRNALVTAVRDDMDKAREAALAHLNSLTS